MKPAELRGMSDAQLSQQLTDLHTEWRNLRFQEAVGKLTDTARVGKIRKDIARIHTIRTERELDAAARELLAQAERS
jgi:large subunit ribosomal protein L29